jgi:hypothetical protein
MIWKKGVPARPANAETDHGKARPAFTPGGFLKALYPEGLPAAVEPTAPPLMGRMVLAVDATGSRQPTWEAAKQLTNTLFHAVPDVLQVALAVHGGGKVHTFTDFLPNARALRKMAAGVECRAGGTQLLPILRRVAGIEGVGVVLYIGDAFEESASKAIQLADQLRANGTRLIVLFEGSDLHAHSVYADLAARTEGALLPFDLSALGRLRDLLAAVGVLAAGGMELLEDKRDTMRGAALLLEHLGSSGKRGGRQ